MKYTFAEIRAMFWDSTSEENRKEYRKTWTQNQYNTDIRCEWVDFVDMLHSNGEITDSQANRITL